MRFSIVTPAYNAGPYIKEMIESVKSQSFTDWELRIVDDCSSDNTKEIIQAAAAEDSRIKTLFLTSNSGSCFLPRRKAIETSEGEYIVNIDADDAVEPDYLLKLDAVIRQTGAELVYADMYLWDGENKEKIIPKGQDVYGKLYTGQSLFRKTLDGWDVSGVAATSRDLALKSLVLFDEDFGRKEAWGAFHDENLTRLDLYLAGKVAFANAEYGYRTVDNSISRQLTDKRLELLKADMSLVGFVARHFGNESEEYALAHRQLFHHVIEFMRLRPKRRGWEKAVREAFNAIDLNAIRTMCSPRYWWLLKSGYPFANMILGIYGGRKR